MSKQRASLGFGDELENFDASTFDAPASAKAKPKAADAEKAARAAGFRSREAEPMLPATQASQPRRRRTGRNAQFNLKTTPETIEAFTRLADLNGWGLGETLERAVELLEREHGKGS